MFYLISEIIPLGLGAAVSPVVLGVVVAIIASKSHVRAKVGLYLLGALAVVGILTFVGYFLGMKYFAVENLDRSYIFDIVLGGVLIIWGTRSFLIHRKIRKREFIVDEKREMFGWFAAGFTMNIVNLNTIFFYIAQLREIIGSPIDVVDKIAANSLSIFFFIAPIIVPFIIYIIKPELVDKVTKPVNGLVKKYGRYASSLLFFFFGAYFIVRAIII